MSISAELSPEFLREYVIAAHFNLEKVKSVLAEHPSLLTYAFEWGPDDFEDGLGAAAHVGNRPIAEFYLSQAVPLTICAAAMLGRSDDVRAFLDSDSSLAAATGAHRIPVMFHAAMSGKTEIAELLVERGGGEGIPFALHGAISHGHLDMARWLLDHGAKDYLDIKNYEGKTPLQKAAELDHANIVDLLRSYGATE
jgi:ankyrin repeat protein